MDKVTLKKEINWEIVTITVEQAWFFNATATACKTCGNKSREGRCRDWCFPQFLHAVMFKQLLRPRVEVVKNR